MLGTAYVAPRGEAEREVAVGHGLGSLAHAADRRHREVALRNMEVALPKIGEAERLYDAIRLSTLIFSPESSSAMPSL